jgi:hypothetical protein
MDTNIALGYGYSYEKGAIDPKEERADLPEKCGYGSIHPEHRDSQE